MMLLKMYNAVKKTGGEVAKDTVKVGKISKKIGTKIWEASKKEMIELGKEIKKDVTPVIEKIDKYIEE